MRQVFLVCFVLLVAWAHTGSAATVFLLAGDSTTATQSADGGGWGDGFKNFTLVKPSFAVNYGHDGTTTASFVAGGDWARVLSQVTANVEIGNTVFVTIQFGHNDQKLANFSAQYTTNLVNMAKDVTSRKGHPVHVTPLSRRNYFPNGTIDDSLEPWAGYTKKAASESGGMLIDLWQNSLTYLTKIGEPAARRLDLTNGDHTHLNVHGSIVFGRMVSDLLVAQSSMIAGVTLPNATLSEQIKKGIPTY